MLSRSHGELGSRDTIQIGPRLKLGAMHFYLCGHWIGTAPGENASLDEVLLWVEASPRQESGMKGAYSYQES